MIRHDQFMLYTFQCVFIEKYGLFDSLQLIHKTKLLPFISSDSKLRLHASDEIPTRDSASLLPTPHSKEIIN